MSLNKTKEEVMAEKPDCYECKYRGEVVGSAHSSCKHPKCADVGQGLGGLLVALSGGHAPQMKTDLKVKGDSHGIRNGWFCHPLNFDPVWLEECNGFEKKEIHPNL